MRRVEGRGSADGARGACRPRAWDRRRAAQHGLSLVELLVGAAIGLAVAAAAGAAIVGSLRENQALLVDARLTEELHATADLMARDLRRAGYWAAAASGVWRRGDASTVSNPYAALAPVGAASDAMRFNVAADGSENGVVDADEEHGFRLRNGAIETQLGRANWQALTDSGTLVVDRFSVTPSVDEIALDGYCSQACPHGSATCPPHHQVRSFAIAIAAHAAVDSRVARTLRQTVRLRNDVVVGACPP